MLVFERLDINDISEVETIEKESFSKPWTREMFEKELTLEQSRFFCGKEKGVIMGYGGFWNMDNDADIITICVHPDHRKKGYGRKILEFLSSKAEEEGAGRIMLEVRKSNNPAQSLYSSCGFVSLGTRPRYYGDEDAVVMEKKI